MQNTLFVELVRDGDGGVVGIATGVGAGSDLDLCVCVRTVGSQIDLDFYFRPIQA